MAEVVREMQERMLPEYEQLKKFEICTDEQIRDCIRKRENYQMRITQIDKSMCDYVEFIIFEKKIHKWVSEKEKLHGKKLAGLKASIAGRIIRLYRDGLKRFPHEERFWMKYIQFCKNSVPHEVIGIYEKMLMYHGDKPAIWCEAALWAYEYSLNIAKVKDIFFRGLQRHPDSEGINKTFFDILLMEAAKMSPEKTSANGATSDQDIGLERVEIVYRSSRKKITNVSYFMNLLERCEEEKYMNFTAPLQKIILDDMMQMFPREECLWDTLAQRELRGFSMCDLKALGCGSNSPTSNKTTELLAAELNTLEEDQDKKNPHLTSNIWKKRTLKCRIEICCTVYQTAVRTLQTPKMWTLYINAMLKLNQDMSTQQVLKRKCLANAFKEGHERGMMSIDHTCTFVRMLLESEEGVAIAESVLSEATKRQPKSLKLYEVWISMYIVRNNESKVYEIFRKADIELEDHALSIWQLTLQFYRVCYDENFKKVIQLYREACQKMRPGFGVFRSEYIEFCATNFSIRKARMEYTKLNQLPPPSLELHQKMALLESQLAFKSTADTDHWRLCHENATYYFGKSNCEVWIDYIKFERDHGDPKRMSLIYQRAKDTLDARLIDNFISEYTLLTAMI